MKFYKYITANYKNIDLTGEKMKKYENMKHGTEEFPVGIHETVCENGFALYPHIHREFEFLVMSEGKGTVYVENEKFELNAGEGIFINSEELHIGVKTDSERACFFAVVFAPEIFGSFALDAVMQKYVEPVIKNKIRPRRRVDESVVKKLCEIKENPSELKIKALIFDIWDICLSDAEKRAELSKKKMVEEVKRVMEYIRENYDKEITLESLAKEVNLSKGYLCREFKNVVHMTPFEYLIEVRLDKGCEMLKNTDLTVGEIAQRCGFNSFSYFSKVFNEKKGLSPREYRQIDCGCALKE